MGHIKDNISALHSQIPPHVKIIAVSKTKSVAQICEAMEAGQKIFGESKVQELTVKHEQIPDAQWHFIGHLQTNKVKYIVPFVQMIQTVDSFRLLAEINRQASKCNRVIDCLLQIHIARESTKYGMNEQEAEELLTGSALEKLTNVRICGLMGIATFTEDEETVRAEFRKLALFFKRLQNNLKFYLKKSFCELSMGMSDDFSVAIAEGATMVRIGSSIFGKRYTSN